MEMLNDTNLKNYDIETIEQYNDMLDDAYPDCEVAGYEMMTSTTLFRCDPTAYRVGLNEFSNGLENLKIMLEERGNG